MNKLSMYRQHLSVILTIATFAGAVIATASPADAQLFRRWREARQAAAPPQYQQQQQLRAQQLQRQPSQQRYRPSTPSSTQPQTQLPSANYSHVPQVVGPVQFSNGTEPSAASRSASRMPTLAEQPKKVSDNLDSDANDSGESSDADEKSKTAESGQKRQMDDEGEDEGLGQSILSRETTNEPAPKASPTARTAGSAAATMGLEVFQYSTPQNGVRVARINKESLADESGLRAGDLIVAIDRTRTRQAADVASILKKHRPGSTLRVQFVRGTTSYVTNVPLIASKFTSANVKKAATAKNAAKEPAAEKRVSVAKPPINGSTPPSSRVKLGMLIQDPKRLRGTVVTKIRPGSIADASGFKEGDRIVSVETKLLESGDRLREIISDLTWGDQLAIGIVRDGQLISRKVKLTQTPDKKIVDAKTPKDAADRSTSKLSKSNLGKSMGSMLGGLFGGSSKATTPDPASETNRPVNDVVQADGQTPETPKNSAISDDPMGFGDDEPIEQVIFQKKTARR